MTAGLVTARYLALGVPVAVLVVAARSRNSPQERGALLLATLAALLGLAALDRFARAAGWWQYADVAGSFHGLPIDLWLGWAVLWGPVPVALRRWVPVPVALLGAGWLDVVAMPRLAPLVQLGPHWLAGEAVGLVVVGLPAILLGRWTADRRHLYARATLQVVVFGGLLGWLIPEITIVAGDGAWPRWTVASAAIVAQAAALGAAPGIVAVREFAARGGGTPFPWDPPVRLVTTGPYAYVANPMQLSAVAVLVLIAAVTGSWSLLGSAVVAVAFSWALAGVHERADLASRFGPAWMAYRENVRDWLPRTSPWRAEPAVIFFAAGCGPCEQARRWLARRNPRGLEFRAAQEYAGGLWRVRYRDADGFIADGLAAVARGLEHAGLSWAAAGWVLRLPILDWFIQLVLNALGLGPRYTGPDQEVSCPTPASRPQSASRPRTSPGAAGPTARWRPGRS
jgi:protein-S-isoprenylcysteine O-methyltransferase Ste14